MKKIGLLATIAVLAIMGQIKSVDAGGEKVTICHKGHTISVSENAVAAHLAHGDMIGVCIPVSGGNGGGNSGGGSGMDGSGNTGGTIIVVRM